LPMPKSMAAYADCEEHFERALNSANGIAITLATPSEAHSLRHKMNTYRAQLRRNSKRVYPEDDSRHGTSPYDAYRLTFDPKDPRRLLVTLHRIEVKNVEEL
jgi:hypothetical protein